MDLTPIRVRGARASRKRHASDWQSWPVKTRKRPNMAAQSSKSEQNILRK